MQFNLVFVKVGHIEYTSLGVIYENKVRHESIPFNPGALVNFSIKDEEIILSVNKKVIFSSKKSAEKIKLGIRCIGAF